MYDRRWWLKCRKGNREVSFIYINGAAGAAAAALCVIVCCFSFCYVDTVCGFATEYTWTWSIIISILYAAARRTSMYSYIPTCCCVLCCYTAVAAAAATCCCLLLLFATVCRMAKFVSVVHCIWLQRFLSLHSNTIFFQCCTSAPDSSVFFLFIQTRFFVQCTPWQHCRIFRVDYFTYNTYHTSSV